MDELKSQIGQEVHVSMTHDKGQKGKLVSIDDRGLLLFMDLTHQTNKAPSRFYFCPWTNVIWIDWPQRCLLVERKVLGRDSPVDLVAARDQEQRVLLEPQGGLKQV